MFENEKIHSQNERIPRACRTGFAFFLEDCAKQSSIIEDRSGNNSMERSIHSAVHDNIIEDCDCDSVCDCISCISSSLDSSCPKPFSADFSKECAHKWKSLSEDVKSHYRELSREDRRRYQNEIQQFQNCNPQNINGDVNDAARVNTNSMSLVNENVNENEDEMQEKEEYCWGEKVEKSGENLLSVNVSNAGQEDQFVLPVESHSIFHSDSGSFEQISTAQTLLADNQINANGSEIETNEDSKTFSPEETLSNERFNNSLPTELLPVCALNSQALIENQLSDSEIAKNPSEESENEDCNDVDEVSVQLLSLSSSPETTVYEDCFTDLSQPEVENVKFAGEKAICVPSSVEFVGTSSSTTQDSQLKILRPLSREEQDSVDDVAFDIFCDDEMPKVRNAAASFERILDELIVRWESLDSNSASEYYQRAIAQIAGH